MSRSVKPRRYGTHRYRYRSVLQWYRTHGNRRTRRLTAALLRKRTFDAEIEVFPHPKLEAFDWWSLT